MRVIRDLWRAWRVGVTWPICAWLLLAGTASAQVLTPSPQGLTAQFSSTCAASTCATWVVGVATSVTVSVTGAGSWTGTFKASSDGGNTYFDATMIRLSDRTNVTTVTDTGDGQYAITNSGITHLQFRLTTWASGGANVWAIRGYGSPMAQSPFANPVVAPASGTCVTPAYTFTGDTDSGIGWLGANNVAGCAGGATIFDWNATRVALGSAIALGWSTDLTLYRDAANTLALRNGTNAQTFNIYNTYSGAGANYERLRIGVATNRYKITQEQAGTGSQRAVDFDFNTYQFQNNGTPKFAIDAASLTATANLIFTDNTYDIGASGATSARTIYSSTSFKTNTGASYSLAAPVAINTAPTIAAGGCTSPAIAANGTATFLVTIGTSCTGVTTFTLTLPAATGAVALWAVDCTNNTSDAAQATNYAVARATSSTAVVVKSYDRVLGVPEDFTASDTYLCRASGG